MLFKINLKLYKVNNCLSVFKYEDKEENSIYFREFIKGKVRNVQLIVQGLLKGSRLYRTPAEGTVMNV
jgi:hypothetical protein